MKASKISAIIIASTMLFAGAAQARPLEGHEMNPTIYGTDANVGSPALSGACANSGMASCDAVAQIPNNTSRDHMANQSQASY